MSATTTTTVSISLEAGCDYAACAEFAHPLHKQLSRGYDICSVLPVPWTVDDWRNEHRTARKRADRSARLGYLFAEIARERYDDQIHEINISLERRQGRRMADSYQSKTHYLPLPDYPCRRHRISTYGVIYPDDVLVAYLWLYRAGELALVSSILGHGEHLVNDVMYLLFQGVVEAEGEHGGLFVYNRWDSGQDGLRYYKSKLGFRPAEVEWRL